MKEFLKRYFRPFRSEESVFSKVYRNNEWWDGEESKSGPGSGLTQTRRLRQELPLLFKELGVRTLLDAPCGDFYWTYSISGLISSER